MKEGRRKRETEREREQNTTQGPGAITPVESSSSNLFPLAFLHFYFGGNCVPYFLPRLSLPPSTPSPHPQPCVGLGFITGFCSPSGTFFANYLLSPLSPLPTVSHLSSSQKKKNNFLHLYFLLKLLSDSVLLIPPTCLERRVPTFLRALLQSLRLHPPRSLFKPGLRY